MSQRDSFASPGGRRLFNLLERRCSCAFLGSKIWGRQDYLGSEILRS